MTYVAASTKPFTARAPAVLRICLCAAACVLVAEMFGVIKLPLGDGMEIALFPFIWALVLGGLWGLISPRLPRALQIDPSAQALSATILQPVLLIFIAKLGFLVGGAVPKILSSGWALAFQEFGHFLGTMLLGLPLALLLGIKREAIGATFSIGREPSLAIIAERFGMASPEGHGVLAEYLTGTVIGAVFIALFAGLITSLHILSPLALAMGAGIGSGSMMVAASSAIAAQQTPEMAKDVAAFAAASNLITTTIGTYFTLFLSLPFTIWAYGFLEPRLGRWRAPARAETAELVQPQREEIRLNNIQLAIVWFLTGVIALVGNYIAFSTVPTIDVVEGMVIIFVSVVLGHMLNRLFGAAVPAVLWVSLIAMVMTYPSMPFAPTVAALTGQINFLALATPVIAFAGLSIARDVPVFRKLGWRIVVVSLVANAGTFLAAAFIAHFFVAAGNG
jgi:hypothetical protein